MKKLGLAALACAVAISAGAQGAARDSRDYLSFLPQEKLERLFSEGEVTNIAGTLAELPLWQRSPFADRIRAVFKGLDASIAAEGFFLFDPPALSTEALDAKIFSSFTAFSTLKGLQVYSVSKGHMETFLFDASAVDPANRSQRLPDPSVDAVPASSDYTVYEKEEQTGDSYARFHVEFDHPADTFAVTVTNLSKMNYLVFTLVEPGNLRTYFFVVPCRDHLVLYGLTAAQTGHFLGLERLKAKSFYYRLRALVSWFSSNVER